MRFITIYEVDCNIPLKMAHLTIGQPANSEALATSSEQNCS